PFLGAQVFLHLGHRLVTDEFGRHAHRGALERLADELRIADRGGADAGDEGADLGTDFDQAVVAKAAERLTDRRPAHTETLAQLGLREPFAGGQLGTDDLVTERRVEVGTGRRPAGPTGGLGGFLAADGNRLGHQVDTSIQVPRGRFVACEGPSDLNWPPGVSAAGAASRRTAASAAGRWSSPPRATARRDVRR